MHDFVLDEGLKPVQDLYKILDGFFFWDVFLFLEVGSEVAFITVLQNQVDVINSLLDINKPNDIVVATRLKDLNFVIKKLSEFTWNQKEVTLDSVPADGFDSNIGSVDFTVTFEDVSELTGTDFFVQDVDINCFRHGWVEVEEGGGCFRYKISYLMNSKLCIESMVNPNTKLTSFVYNYSNFI